PRSENRGRRLLQHLVRQLPPSTLFLIVLDIILARHLQNSVNPCARSVRVSVTTPLPSRRQETRLLRGAASDLVGQSRSDRATSGVAVLPMSHGRLFQAQHLVQFRADPLERRQVRTSSRDIYVSIP